MNYYPYMNMANIPYVANIPAKTGLFANLFKNFNFGSVLNGTGKVLNIANQAIPLIKQAKPVINNAKTMFQVMNEFRKVDIPKENTQTEFATNIKPEIKPVNVEKNNQISTQPIISSSAPTFFQ